MTLAKANFSVEPYLAAKDLGYKKLETKQELASCE